MARAGGGEVIVADHGSRDSTAALARWLGAKVVDASSARTIAAVRNLGAAAASGRVLAFLDADCVVDEGWLEAGLRLFDECPDAGAAGLPPRAPRDEAWIARASALFASPRAPLAREATRWLPSANLLVRREAFEEVGGFDPALATCEDYDLSLRIRSAGFELLRDPALGAVHLREPASLSGLFRKERWRGLASIQGAFRHGLTLGELPSLGLPVWHACSVAALALALPFARPAPIEAALLALALPSLALAARVALKAGQPRAFPGLVAFSLVYCAARTAALVPETLVHPEIVVPSPEADTA
jgi:hypothetical protein